MQKFGGTSVANVQRVLNVAEIVTKTYSDGNDVIVVVSAQGDTTDDLLDKAKQINEDASKREMDVLLTAGEQISISLLAIAIEKLGYPVVSLLGWQAGFKTDSAYGSARIENIDSSRIEKELDKRNIVNTFLVKNKKMVIITAIVLLIIAEIINFNNELLY